MKKMPKNFEEAITQLENITQIMQNPDTSLEDALKHYENGRHLLNFCQQKLTEVEQKLQILDNGELKEITLDES